MTNALALLGGEPVRNEPYPAHTTILDDEEEKAAIEIIRGGHLSGFSARPGDRFLGGSKSRQLENDFARYFGVKHAVSFNSATSALHGLISAAKIGPGDEVIVTPFTMSATAMSVIMQNAIPIFADIEDETYGLDPSAVEKAITSKTKAILTVNLFGHPSRLEELESIANKYSILLLEDNSQSPGATCQGRMTGAIGKMGVQSLNYHKCIQTGEGGIALTNDDDCADHLRLVRNHGEVVIGQTENYNASDLINLVGWNYRLTEIQAAIGIPQLRKLSQLNAIRIDLAELLTARLLEYDFLIPALVREGCTHVYYLFPIRFLSNQISITREIFVHAMRAEGISIAHGYVRPIYLEPMFQKKIAYGKAGCPFLCPLYGKKTSYNQGICPTAERLHFEEIMTTDICKYPNSEKEVDEFATVVEKIVNNIDKLRE